MGGREGRWVGREGDKGGGREEEREGRWEGGEGMRGAGDGG